MTKDEIVAHIASETGQSKTEAANGLTALTDLIATELRAGRHFVLRELGTLKPKTSAARSGRNPSTGATIAIPEKKSVKFTANAKLLSELNA